MASRRDWQTFFFSGRILRKDFTVKLYPLNTAFSLDLFDFLSNLHGRDAAVLNVDQRQSFFWRMGRKTNTVAGYPVTIKRPVIGKIDHFRNSELSMGMRHLRCTGFENSISWYFRYILINPFGEMMTGAS